ncbi:hypothetical protein [Streptomyces sp. MBT62]|uniref:hypothetical protein n=1 Tax=Streptomyces sp. MBT62 TaxID=2800410 RepID=UPI00190A80CB|nr:hypothetical protein [Streptomyces sp. MBT62]MBK3564527.1 hypothetical protein [Streptomyces sp. MBT62]
MSAPTSTDAIEGVAFHFILTAQGRHGETATLDGVAYLDPALTSRAKFFDEMRTHLAREMGLARVSVLFFALEREAL